MYEITPEIAAALMLGGDGGGDTDDGKANRMIMKRDDKSYINPANEKDVPAFNTYNGTYTDWKNKTSAEKANYYKTVFSDETYDSITIKYFDYQGGYDDAKEKVYGIGIWNRGTTDEEVIRIIYPDGDFTLTEGFSDE